MKEIPLRKYNNGLFLYCKINKSANIEFQLDTGCGSTVINKEVADYLFLTGRLTDSDITGTATSNYGGHYQTEQQTVNIKSLTLGKVKIKDVTATLCNRYGGTMLMGMSVLDKLPGFSISMDKFIIDDGKPDTTIVTNKVGRSKANRRHCVSSLRKLKKVVAESGVEDYKFDYTKWILTIYDPIQTCSPLLREKKTKQVIAILEELKPLIQRNLEDDEENPKQRGAFITAYFNYYLASAYYQANREEEALKYYDKASKFFMYGTSVDAEIRELSSKLRKKLSEEGRLADMKHEEYIPNNYDEDIKKLSLQKITFVDNIYGEGEEKEAYIGFNEYKDAFEFGFQYSKRMEILKKVDCHWERINLLPTDNLKADLLFARHGHNLTGASPQRGLIAASVQPKARVSVAMRNLKETLGKALT